MISSIRVKAEREYDVIFSQDWRNSLLSLISDRVRCAVVVTQSMREQVGNLVAGDCEFTYCVIPDGEEGKTPHVLLQLWNWMAAAGFTRSDVVLGIGGGATTDIAGFAAATYLRGVDWMAVPTSIAGSVDAAIGGKTGANLDYGKNLVGSFYSPIAVLLDDKWFETLSDRDFAAGLAEVIKCGFISDGQILTLVKGKSISEIRGDRQLLRELVTRSVQVKANVVGSDFKESFNREILNYGHTFGHAVERHSAYQLRHGECVSIGMAFMAHLQLHLGLISQEVFDLHFSLLQGLGLPVNYSGGSWAELNALMSLDKKSRGSVLRFVTIGKIGETNRLENVAQGDLLYAYERVCS